MSLVAYQGEYKQPPKQVQLDPALFPRRRRGSVAYRNNATDDDDVAPAVDEAPAVDVAPADSSDAASQLSKKRKADHGIDRADFGLGLTLDNMPEYIRILDQLRLGTTGTGTISDDAKSKKMVELIPDTPNEMKQIATEMDKLTTASVGASRETVLAQKLPETPNINFMVSVIRYIFPRTSAFASRDDVTADERKGFLNDFAKRLGPAFTLLSETGDFPTVYDKYCGVFAGYILDFFTAQKRKMKLEDELKALLASHKKETEKLYAEHKGETVKLEGIIDNLRKDGDKLQEQINNLRAEAKNLDGKMENDKKLIRELEEKKNQLVTENQNLQNRMIEMKDSQSTQNDRIIELSNELNMEKETKQRQLVNLQQQLIQEENKTTKLERELKKTKEELEIQTRAREIQESYNKEFERKLKEAMENNKKSVDQINSNASRYSKDTTRLSDEIQSLKEQLRVSRQATENPENSLTTQYVRMQVHVDLQNEHAGLKNRIDSLQHEKKSLENELRQKTVEYTKNNTELKQLYEDEKTRLEAKLATATKNHTEAQTNNKTLIDRNSELDRVVLELQHSLQLVRQESTNFKKQAEDLATLHQQQIADQSKQINILGAEKDTILRKINHEFVILQTNALNLFNISEMKTSGSILPLGLSEDKKSIQLTVIFRDWIIALSQYVNTLTTEQHDLNTTNTSQKSQLASLARERDTYKTRSEDQQREIQRIQKETEDKLFVSEEGKLTLQQSISELENKIRNAERDTAAVRAQLATINKEKTDTQSKLEETKNSLDEMAIQYDTINKKHDTLKKEFEKTVKLLNGLQEIERKLREKNDEQLRHINEKSAEIERLNDLLSATDPLVRENERQLKALEDEKKRHQEYTDRLKESHGLVVANLEAKHTKLETENRRLVSEKDQTKEEAAKFKREFERTKKLTEDQKRDHEAKSTENQIKITNLERQIDEKTRMIDAQSAEINKLQRESLDYKTQLINTQRQARELESKYQTVLTKQTQLIGSIQYVHLQIKAIGQWYFTWYKKSKASTNDKYLETNEDNWSIQECIIRLATHIDYQITRIEFYKQQYNYIKNEFVLLRVWVNAMISSPSSSSVKSTQSPIRPERKSILEQVLARDVSSSDHKTVTTYASLYKQYELLVAQYGIQHRKLNQLQLDSYLIPVSPTVSSSDEASIETEMYVRVACMDTFWCLAIAQALKTVDNTLFSKITKRSCVFQCSFGTAAVSFPEFVNGRIGKTIRYVYQFYTATISNESSDSSNTTPLPYLVLGDIDLEFLNNILASAKRGYASPDEFYWHIATTTALSEKNKWWTPRPSQKASPSYRRLCGVYFNTGLSYRDNMAQLFCREGPDARAMVMASLKEITNETDNAAALDKVYWFE